MESTSGVITSLQVCPGHGLPMRRVDPAAFLADLGLEGCSHAVAGSRRQVLLMDQETLDDLDLEPAILKENVTTRDIDLAALPAETRLRLENEVELWITGPCDPCHLMDQIRAGLKDELRGRRGVLAWVKTGGTAKIGDRIEAHPPGTSEE